MTFKPLAQLPPLVALAFFLFLGKLLQVSNGEYRYDYLRELILAWSLTMIGLTAFATRFPEQQRTSPLSLKWAMRALALCVVYFSVQLAIRPQVQYNELKPAYQAIKGLLILAAFASAGLAALTWWRKPLPTRAFWALCGVAAASWLACRVLTVAYSPHPFIDTFTIATAAADYFLAGLNPYPQKYVDIYNGYYPYPPVYPYWPGVIYAQTLTRWLFGDIRYSFVLADVATVCALFRISRSLRLPAAVAGLASLAWLAFPVSLHVLEMSWTDVLLVGAGAWAAALLLERKWWLAGAALGYFCGCKQYTVFFGALMVLAVGWQAGARAFAQCCAAATAVFALLLVPFAVSDFQALYDSTFKMLMTIPLRPDSLSIPAGFYREGKGQLDGGVMALSYVLALGLGIAWLKRLKGSFQAFTGGLVLVYGVVFLMGKQAFCNYYYLLASFTLLAFLARLEPQAAPEG